jgi:chromosome segregation ATPase
VTKANLDGALVEAIASRNVFRELETHSVARITWESTRTELDAALAAAQRDLQDSVGRLTGERSAWAGRRQDLEARIVEVQAAVSTGASLQTALETSRYKLQEFSEQCASERTAWDSERQSLETRIADLEIVARSADELQAALDETRGKLRQTFDLHSQQQRVWEIGRRDLETEINSLQIAVAANTGLEEALDAAHRELHQTRDRYASDRSAWDLTQRELDARVEDATGQATSAQTELAAVRGSLEKERRALADARAEIERIVEAARTELAARHAIQADLEQQVNTLQTTAAAAKTAADDALAVARRELKQTQERHASDRSAWHKDRRERDARIADVTTKADAARTELDGLRRSLDGERQALKNARAEIERMADDRRSELAARDAVQADLERQVQANAASQRDVEIALVAARTALTDAEATHAAAWSSWEAARQRFEKDLETRDEEARTAAAANSDLEAQLTATRSQLQVASDEHAATSAAAKEAHGHLETRLQDLQTTTAELERALATSHANVQQTCEAHEAQQAQGDAARRRLVSELAETKREAAAAQARALSSWEMERQRFEQILEAHQADLNASVAENAGLDTVLADVRSDLQRANADHRARSDDWAAARGELEARLGDLEATRQRLENQLQASHRELDEALQAQAARIAADDAVRQQLESEVGDLRQGLSAHAAMRSAWDTERLKFESDFAACLALVTEATAARTDLESRFEVAQSDLKRLGDSRADEAAAWEAARQQLEAELAGRTEMLDAGASARAALQADVDTLRADLRQARVNQTSEREQWDALRLQFEERLRDAAASDRERQRLDDELLETRSRHGRLSAAHEMLGLQLGEATSRVRRLADESAGLRAELQALSLANDRHRLEERLHRACRIEEVGQLAATMVPDLDALVSTIEDECGRLARRLDQSDAREDAERIRGNSERVRRMLSQLSAFSERQARPVSAVDVDDAVRRLEPTLARLAGTAVDVNVRVGSQALVPILDDDLEHLLTTLVFGARALLTVGGSIILQTSVASRDETGRSRLCLAVTASGYGAQPAESSPALELMARRCSAEIVVDGAPGTSVLRVYMPVMSIAA